MQDIRHESFTTCLELLSESSYAIEGFKVKFPHHHLESIQEVAAGSAGATSPLLEGLKDDRTSFAAISPRFSLRQAMITVAFHPANILTSFSSV